MKKLKILYHRIMVKYHFWCVKRQLTKLGILWSDIVAEADLRSSGNEGVGVDE